MGKIGNKELSRVLTEKHGLERSDADRFVELMFDVLNNGLKEEKLVKVKGLGTFKTFGRGWTRRVEEVQAKACGMVTL